MNTFMFWIGVAILSLCSNILFNDWPIESLVWRQTSLALLGTFSLCLLLRGKVIKDSIVNGDFLSRLSAILLFALSLSPYLALIFIPSTRAISSVLLLGGFFGWLIYFFFIRPILDEHAI